MRILTEQEVLERERELSSLERLQEHARKFEADNRDSNYDENRKTTLYTLWDDECAIERFQCDLFEALEDARKEERPWPVVIAKHSMRDFAEVVNGDVLYESLTPYAFHYAILVEFTR